MVAKLIHIDMSNRISNLTIQLMAEHPFFGIFLAHTSIIRENTFSTAATDGIRIYYNSDFFAQLTDQEVKGVLLHECLHMVYSHCDKKRRGIRKPNKWNIATDQIINNEIDQMDKAAVNLPHNKIISGKPFKIYLDRQYRNMYAEQVYDLLSDDLCNEEGLDIHLDMPIDEDTRRELEDRIMSSYELAKDDHKKISDGIIRTANEIRNSRLPWSRMLHRYVGSALMKDDYSYATFNRRYLSQEMYLPGLRSYKVGKVGIFVDTSASIKDTDMASFAGEIKKISGLTEEVIVASWDTSVHSWAAIRSLSGFQDAIKKLGGYGGTDNKCIWTAIKKKKSEFDLVIVLSDGEFGILPTKNPIGVPVIFVITTMTNIGNKFGVVVRMRV
jgi:predicted metal-dependent peptidase